MDPVPIAAEEEAISDAAVMQGPTPSVENPDLQAAADEVKEQPVTRPASPLGDYVRELGEEFQDQEEEGKIEP